MNGSSSRDTATSIPEAFACLAMLRSASAITDCASGSSSAGTATSAGHAARSS